jgi:hypothetical protein
MNRKIVVGFVTFFLIFAFISCNTIKELSKQITNLQKCQFKLENVAGFKLVGIELSKVSSLKDLNLLEAAKLLQTFNKKQVPVSFTLNVAALNPNDGTSGSAKSTVTLSKLDWNLLIDGVQTINGTVNKSIELPGTNQKTIIPLEIGLDLYKFFGDKGYESLINTALAIGGVSGSASKLTLNATPTISTPFGPMTYPHEIAIIDKEFRGN